MKSRQEVIRAFAELPDDITTRDIAGATGRTERGVQNWITGDPSFPGESAPPRGRTKVRSNRAVLEWYLKQSFAGDGRPGPRGIGEIARRVQPERERMNIQELAGVLSVTPAAVRHHITANPPGGCADPFPEAGDDGKRAWAQVRSWLLRHDDPLPEPDIEGTRDWDEVRAWLLRNRSDGQGHRDVEGLTLGQYDIVERARAAEAAGVRVSAEWLSVVLGVETGVVGRLLSKAPARTQSVRLRPTALARHFGLTVSQVKGFERAHGAEGHDDPFPGKDASSARAVDDVRAWLVRNNRLPTAPTAGGRTPRR